MITPGTPLIVATGNAGKLEEMQHYLEGWGWALRLKPPELEVAETGTTFAENARLKATQVAQATGEWAIADDSGLTVDALQGAPGVYSARYGATDGERIGRLLRELEGQPNRKAQFRCVIALARPDGEIALEAGGTCPGQILSAPQGQGGFGYDPVFYLPELGLTFAEMSPAQKRKMSHRGYAFQVLLPQLEKLMAMD